MHKPQPLGCLSPLALVSLLITLVALGAAFFVSGGGMFSPGELNAQRGAPLGGVTAHADRSRDCAACHPPPWSGETMSGRCMKCHTAVLADLQTPSTLHGALAAHAQAAENPPAQGFSRGAFSCRECHTEHHGPAAALTRVDPDAFPHQATGFSLAAHQRMPSVSDLQRPFTCPDCHGETVSAFDPSACRDCHARLDDGFTRAHAADFGGACLRCHDGADRFSGFDHRQTAYPLDGAHATVGCSGCHAGARSAGDFAAAPRACVDCHRADDAHGGSFGDTCQTCHQPTAWQEADFDHHQTGFALDGAHARVECRECHGDRLAQRIQSACHACHAEPPYHAGLFPQQDCSACHQTAAWRPAEYSGPHAFPMNHGGRANACADCHQPNLTQWTCSACHDPGETQEEHTDEGIFEFADCLRCHATGAEPEGD